MRCMKTPAVNRIQATRPASPCELTPQIALQIARRQTMRTGSPGSLATTARLVICCAIIRGGACWAQHQTSAPPRWAFSIAPAARDVGKGLPPHDAAWHRLRSHPVVRKPDGPDDTLTKHIVEAVRRNKGLDGPALATGKVFSTAHDHDALVDIRLTVTLNDGGTGGDPFCQRLSAGTPFMFFLCFLLQRMTSWCSTTFQCRISTMPIVSRWMGRTSM